MQRRELSTWARRTGRRLRDLVAPSLLLFSAIAPAASAGDWLEQLQAGAILPVPKRGTCADLPAPAGCELTFRACGIRWRSCGDADAHDRGEGIRVWVKGEKESAWAVAARKAKGELGCLAGWRPQPRGPYSMEVDPRRAKDPPPTVDVGLVEGYATAIHQNHGGIARRSRCSVLLADACAGSLVLGCDLELFEENTHPTSQWAGDVWQRKKLAGSIPLTWAEQDARIPVTPPPPPVPR